MTKHIIELVAEETFFKFVINIFSNVLQLLKHFKIKLILITIELLSDVYEFLFVTGKNTCFLKYEFSSNFNSISKIYYSKVRNSH